MSNVPESSLPIQQEGLVTGSPVSESTWQLMGGVVNFVLANLMPVGSIIPSFLDEPTFQSQTGGNWVLADGRGVTGTRFQTLTGLANLPDLRGMILRGKNSGGSSRGVRADGYQNPDGDLAVGTFQNDQMRSHNHSYTMTQFLYNAGRDGGGEATVGYIAYVGTSTGDVGGNETRVKTVTVNHFVRIN